MFSLAYVILPFGDSAPADAIRASLAPFQRAGRGEMPDDCLAFDDETAELMGLHEAWLTFTDSDGQGMRFEVGDLSHWHLDTQAIGAEMRRLGLARWRVRFADSLDLETFHDRYCRALERHPSTGAFGRWRNPLGHWDWWDLGGRFDGVIIGDPGRGAGRGTAQLSSGDNPGRALLTNIEHVLRKALDQAPPPVFDVRTDRNIELVETLLTDLRADLPHACPATIVLPPGCAADALRWVDKWREIRPLAALDWLGLARDAAWEDVAGAAYARFRDHWVAGIAYHH